MMGSYNEALARQIAEREFYRGLDEEIEELALMELVNKGGPLNEFTRCRVKKIVRDSLEVQRDAIIARAVEQATIILDRLDEHDE